MQTLDPNLNPVRDAEPPLTFAQIDRACMCQLVEIGQGISTGTLDEKHADQLVQNCILGTLKEMLRTLAALHPEAPQIMLPGVSGHG